LDKTKLNTFLTGINERLKVLRKDFNIVKSIFYTGVVNPADVVTSVHLLQRATSDTTEDEITNSGTKNYSITTSTIISTLSTGSANPTTPEATAGNGATTPSGTVVTPTATINTSGTQNDSLTARWAAYGWTATEAAVIKASSSGTAVRWSPDMCLKGRIVVPIMTVGVTPTATALMMQKLGQYYGTGKSVAEYVSLNNGRKAEIWALGQQILDLDNTGGRI
jgi:hypothetical protein